MNDRARSHAFRAVVEDAVPPGFLPRYTGSDVPGLPLFPREGWSGVSICSALLGVLPFTAPFAVICGLLGLLDHS